MDFRLTDDQRALRRGVRALLEGRFGREALRAALDRADGEGAAGGRERADGRLRGDGRVLDRGLWRELGAAGFFALRLPEGGGGAGQGLPEAVLAFEEAGRVLLPGPLIATHLAAGAVAGAATGEAVVTSADGGLVEWLDEADVVLGDVTGAEPLAPLDPLTPVHRLPGAGAARTPDGLLVSLLSAAEQLGSAARTCEIAAQHARTREQFGRPVGAFQAVQHLCADMLVRVETARAAVYAASVTADPADVAAARLLADEAAVRGARDCLQVHGGMGFTWESDVHLHLKRAWTRTHRAGGATRSEEELAEDLVSGAV
ncbi:acyl-CoA dehydrogenase [Streptomyces populi]|uniref:Acyl-CoA dehydrogenase n=1 Tax=Streptomyces populi TaxID=2058924 RepID=A0A2I0SDC9_9ACTN|nr:acyl-CoA dehydrogenase family protein [Streptomyces populi]PKT67957.1 acyl-CoA dehydrogenase [Streptomyces populi]